MERVLLCVLLSGLVGLIKGAAPTDLEEIISGPRGAKCYIAHKGGTIRMHRELAATNGTNKTQKTGEIAIVFTELRELNANFSQVTDSDKKTHTLNTFNDQTFSCLPDKNRLLPFSDVTGDCLQCSTSLKNNLNGSEFRISACVTTKNGTIRQDDETTYVKEGQLKFSVEIYHWHWCTSNCIGGPGQYLDLDIGIKIPGGDGRGFSKNSGNASNATVHQPTMFNLGAGAVVQFSNKVYMDDVWKSITTGVPSTSVKNGMNVVSLRFPYFKDRMLYDPTLESGDTVYVAAAQTSSASYGPNVGMFQIAVYFIFSTFVGIYSRQFGV